MIDSTGEYILCSAIWYDDGVRHEGAMGEVPTGIVLCGYRHCDIIRIAPTNQYFEGGLIHFDRPVKTMQGFLTSWGRFVKRETAALIAKHCGQVDETIGGMLTSEDLY